MTTTATKLRASLLSQAASVVAHRCALAKGDKPTLPMALVVLDDFEKVWEAVVPMMRAAGDVHKLTVEQTSDVLSLLAQGIVTFAEAKELMELLKTQQDIEELPKLIEAISGE